MNEHRKLWDVVVVGDFFIDIVMSGFYELPTLGEEAFAKTMRQEVGGGAAITSCGLARLESNVAVLGTVGKDDGMWIVKRLIGAGVNASALKNDPDQQSGVTVSVSTSEDRAFFTYYGANESLPALLRDPRAYELMASARHVHFACGPDLLLDAHLFPRLREAGCTTSLDVGWHVGWLTDPRCYQTLAQNDLFFPNHREAGLMTGEGHPERMIRTLESRGVRNIALKLGREGAMLLWEGELYHSSSLRVDAVDTTGAGDCFDAGFIHGWLCGESPATCLDWGTVCGSLSTLRLGGIASFPTKDELLDAFGSRSLGR